MKQFVYKVVEGILDQGLLDLERPIEDRRGTILHGIWADGEAAVEYAESIAADNGLERSASVKAYWTNGRHYVGVTIEMLR